MLIIILLLTLYNKTYKKRIPLKLKKILNNNVNLIKNNFEKKK